ncbi:MAG TPA: hypothetical protein VG737_01235 [Cyclobacteriaceae bacterium]|nr:hypothetical protein [Cyclobacteriaceae bacterium]
MDLYIKLLKDLIGWGIILWLIGFILGFLLFFVAPVNAIDWIVMPVGIAVTLWVAITKIYDYSLRGYFILGITWAALAILLDYVFIVKMINPPDGYYKLDVYLYYVLTVLLPVVAGVIKTKKT